MTDIMELNKKNRIKLMKRIMKSDGNYRLFCIDVDDVIFDTDTVMQEILDEYELEDNRLKATKAFRAEISNETSEDSQIEINKSFAMLDAILEETEFEYEVEELNGSKDKKRVKFKPIDYEKVYLNENLFPNAIDNINYMIKNKKENDFFIFLSHRNPVQEGIIKTKKLYELVPNIDYVFTLPYHIEFGSKEVNSKGRILKQHLGLDCLENCYLIDNSRSNCLDFRAKGGLDIRYLPKGYEISHKFSDHMAKITSLDPYMIQFAIAYIRYVKSHPEEKFEENIQEFKKVKSKNRK